MFCKNCGADAPNNTATKCPRCGEPFSAKSDCGGFYDLVHTTPKKREPVAAPPTAAPMTPPPRYEPAPAPVPEQKGFFPLSYDLFAAIVSGVMILLLILCVVLMLQLKRANDQIAQNTAQILSLHDDVSDAVDNENNTPAPTDPKGEDPEATTPEQTEPQDKPQQETQKPEQGDQGAQNPEQETQTPEQETQKPEQEKNPWDNIFGGGKKTSQKDIDITALLTGNKVNTVNALLKGETEEENESAVVEGDDLNDVIAYENDFLSRIAFDIDPDTEGMTFDIAVGTEADEGDLKINVELVKFDTEIFGSREGELTFTWQYRKIKNGKTGDWKELDSKIFTAGTEGLNAFLICTDDSIGLDLQLVITRTNSEGKLLTITLEGLTITEDLFNSVTQPDGAAES